MKIAQIAMLYGRVPERKYGSWERVVYHLTEELVRLGHDVTLYATGDSRTSARLVPCFPQAMVRTPGIESWMAPHHDMYRRVVAEAKLYDVIHFHSVFGAELPFTDAIAAKSITTLHHSLDMRNLNRLASVPVFETAPGEAYVNFRRHALRNFTSLSLRQQSAMPFLNWIANVPHGLPPDLYRLRKGRGGYVAFLGSTSQDKRPDRAIRIAALAGENLRIAARLDRDNAAAREYQDNVVDVLTDGRKVQYVGQVTDRQKAKFLGNASALLFPVDVHEAFGLVAIEAMACGTPVIGWRRGAIPEVVEDGITGFVVDSIDEAVLALRRSRQLDRNAVRMRFEQRFSARRMAEGYLTAYRQLLARVGRAA